MGIGDFGQGSSSTGTKTTYYQFENPSHEDSKDHEDPQEAERHFRAAKYIQERLGPDRHRLVGEFLWAVMQFEENGEEEALQNVVEQVTN